MKTLTYAIRFLTRSKAYTLINLLGLAFSLACCIILMRYIHRELTVDTHCVDRERTIVTIRDINNTRYIGNLEGARRLFDKEDIRQEEILKQCSFIARLSDNLIYGKESYTSNVLIADSTFFHFFDYPLVAGTKRLSAPDDAILTRRFAQKMFGEHNAIGKTLTYNNKVVTVRGVIDEPSCKSSLNFDALLSIHLTHDWGQFIGEFIHVLPHVDLDAINRETNVFRIINNYNMRYQFTSWKDFYYDNDTVKTLFLEGSRSHLYLLSGVALLLLLVGVLNFVNIYMVLMMTRSKEYGIKKVFGLQGFRLFVQIWLENLLLVISALLVAWLFIEITQIPVNRLFQEPIGYTWFDLRLSLGFILIMPILTSIYPFIRYNYRTAITSMRSIGTNRQSIRMRMAFLFVQYILTVNIIIISLYFGKHLDFMQNTPPGFRTEGILNARLEHERVNYGQATMEELKAIWNRQAQILQKLKECPLIEKLIFDADVLRDYTNITYNDRDQQVECTIIFTTYEFFEFFDIPIIEGQVSKFEDEHDYRIVLNRAAMKAFGYQTKDEAFIRWRNPEWVYFREGKLVEGGTQLTPVTAVAENHYTGHLTKGFQPTVFILMPREDKSGLANIRIYPGKEKEIIEYLKGVVKEIYGTEDFKYTWQKDELLALYENDRQVTIIYSVFALIAIVISCLGLFGISLFDVRQRYREIALRKVHGAGMKDLYQLLFKKYLLVLGAAFVVAAPLAYYLIHQYTADFAIKAPMGFGIFVIGLLLVALISMGTLYWQIRKAANINPAIVMKRE